MARETLTTLNELKSPGPTSERLWSSKFLSVKNNGAIGQKGFCFPNKIPTELTISAVIKIV